MSDVVVTVPKSFGLKRWIAEGDPARVPCHRCLMAANTLEKARREAPKDDDTWRPPWDWTLPCEHCGPSERPTGHEWGFSTGGGKPNSEPGERVYVVCNRALRGYAPLVRVEKTSSGVCFVRAGQAVAVTIDEIIVGFRGWRYRWWDFDDEKPFPKWQEIDFP